MVFSANRAPYLTEIVNVIIGLLLADDELMGPPLNGNIYPDIEPFDGQYPVLIVAGATGEVLRTVSSAPVWRDATIQITARDKGGTDTSALILIMRRVSILLEGRRVQTDDTAPERGIYIGKISEARERPRGPELLEGVRYPQLVVEYDMKAYRPSV